MSGEQPVNGSGGNSARGPFAAPVVTPQDVPLCIIGQHSEVGTTGAVPTVVYIDNGKRCIVKNE
jgi:hypothetical protein